MDARWLGYGGLLCGLILTTGCELLPSNNSGPNARQEQNAKPASEPQIVAQPATSPQQASDARSGGEVDPRVSAYLDHLQNSATPGAESAAPTQPTGSASGAPSRFEATIPVQRVDTINRPPNAAQADASQADLPTPRLVLVDESVPDPIDITAVPVGVTKEQPRASQSPAAAPQLNGVIVNGGALNAGNATTHSTPAANSGSPAGFKDVLQALRNGEQDDSFRGQLDDRVMHVIAGEYAQAREPLRLVSDEQQALAKSLIETLIVSRDEFHLGNQDSAATKMNLELNTLVRSLGKVSDLRIPRFEICPINGIRGYGNYDPLTPAEFVTGQPVAMATYCEIQNLRTEQDANGWYRSKLDMRTTVLTAGGDVILELDDKGIVDRCATERRDFFVARPIQLPATLAPGSYVIKTTIKDKLGEKVAQGRTEFRVIVR